MLIMLVVWLEDLQMLFKKIGNIYQLVIMEELVQLYWVVLKLEDQEDRLKLKMLQLQVLENAKDSIMN